MFDTKIKTFWVMTAVTSKQFLTGFEFPHLCEAEDMDSVMTLVQRLKVFLHVVLTPILFILFVLNLIKYTGKLFIE